MKIGAEIRGMPDVRKALSEIGRQAPYALSVGLNAAANDAQRAIQDSLASRFTVRRAQFVRNTIFRQRGVDFATKANLRAVVRVNPERDFLVQHEEGGQKVAMSGTHVAIPLPTIKPTAATVVPKRLRPGALRGTGQIRKITTNSGTFLVRNRPGRGKGQLTGWRTEFLYQLKRSVPLRPRLGFIDTASRTVDATLVRRVLEGIDRAMASAR